MSPSWAHAPNVTAPTLYRHYRNANGLLSAAIAEAFAQFLESKKAAVRSADPVMALRKGWDDCVRFAADRPRLYVVMMSRVLDAAGIPAAEQAFALLIARIEAIAAEGRLARPRAFAPGFERGRAGGQRRFRHLRAI